MSTDYQAENISAFLDGEMSEEQARAFLAAIEQQPEAAAELRRMLKLRELIADACKLEAPAAQVPPAAQARWQQALRAEAALRPAAAATATPKILRPRDNLWRAAAPIAATLLITAGILWFFNPAPDNASPAQADTLAMNDAPIPAAAPALENRAHAEPNGNPAPAPAELQPDLSPSMGAARMTPPLPKTAPQSAPLPTAGAQPPPPQTLAEAGGRSVPPATVAPALPATPAADSSPVLPTPPPGRPRPAPAVAEGPLVAVAPPPPPAPTAPGGLNAPGATAMTDGVDAARDRMIADAAATTAATPAATPANHGPTAAANALTGAPGPAADADQTADETAEDALAPRPGPRMQVHAQPLQPMATPIPAPRRPDHKADLPVVDANTAAAADHAMATADATAAAGQAGANLKTEILHIPYNAQNVVLIRRWLEARGGSLQVLSAQDGKPLQGPAFLGLVLALPTESPATPTIQVAVPTSETAALERYVTALKPLQLPENVGNPATDPAAAAVVASPAATPPPAQPADAAMEPNR